VLFQRSGPIGLQSLPHKWGANFSIASARIHGVSEPMVSIQREADFQGMRMLPHVGEGDGFGEFFEDLFS
jgi:hypothetical protein